MIHSLTAAGAGLRSSRPPVQMPGTHWLNHHLLPLGEQQQEASPAESQTQMLQHGISAFPSAASTNSLYLCLCLSLLICNSDFQTKRVFKKGLSESLSWNVNSSPVYDATRKAALNSGHSNLILALQSFFFDSQLQGLCKSQRAMG